MLTLLLKTAPNPLTPEQRLRCTCARSQLYRNQYLQWNIVDKYDTISAPLHTSLQLCANHNTHLMRLPRYLFTDAVIGEGSMRLHQYIYAYTRLNSHDVSYFSCPLAFLSPAFSDTLSYLPPAMYSIDAINSLCAPSNATAQPFSDNLTNNCNSSPIQGLDKTSTRVSQKRRTHESISLESPTSYSPRYPICQTIGGYRAASTPHLTWAKKSREIMSPGA